MGGEGGGKGANTRGTVSTSDVSDGVARDGWVASCLRKSGFLGWGLT